jgi:N-acetyl-gamma-glutamyl-phosphate/LysW-gamma-L-alpha-aminoadipyl-6-phosphate reductase
VKVGIIGASGYVGGEILRILLQHPMINVEFVTSRKYAGEYVFKVNPNLKGLTQMRFSNEDPISVASKVDVVFLALPHGASMNIVPHMVELGVKIIDMSADFRLKDPDNYKKWYGIEHKAPDLLNKFIYGLPELHRNELKNANYVAVPGCIATASILSLAPLAKFGLTSDIIIIDAKVGSSGSGSKPSLSSHFSERFGVIRPYKPVGHRHTAEIEQELKSISGREHKIALSAHSVNMVRGILTTSHVLNQATDSIIWKAYRSVYQNEPFIRFIKDRKGLYKYPDPKIVIGSNFMDIGFETDTHTNRIVIIGAIDNLVKGAAGNAVQSMNIIFGFKEDEGLKTAALHPV